MLIYVFTQLFLTNLKKKWSKPNQNICGFIEKTSYSFRSVIGKYSIP